MKRAVLALAIFTAMISVPASASNFGAQGWGGPFCKKNPAVCELYCNGPFRPTCPV